MIVSHQGSWNFHSTLAQLSFSGMKVPDVLLSGHHVNIRRWRMKQSLRKTWERRPDLLENYDFTDEERQILEEIKAEGK